MPVLTSKLIATLVDQISGPAKVATTSLNGMGRAVTSLNAMKGGAQGPQAAAIAMRQFSRDAQDAFRKAEAASHRFAHEMQHGIGLAALASGAAIGEALKSGIEAGADFAHQQALFRSVGMTGTEVAQATAEAWRTTGEVAGSTIAGNLQAVRELRGVFGDTPEAIERLAEVQRASAMMRAINPALNGEQQTFDLAKALEIKGVSQDPAHFAKLLNEMVRASNAFGGKVSGTDFLEFTKYARGAAPRLSDEFFSQIAPTFIQELSGSGAGTALATMRSKIVGGKMSNKSAEAWASLGMLDPASIIRTRTGDVKGFRSGGMKGTDLFQTNPYEWVQQYLLPALTKKGITDPEKISETLARLFGDRTSEQLASMFLTQQSRFGKDAANQRKAEGAEGYEKLRWSDPITGFAAFRGAFSNLLSALTSPLMRPAALALGLLTDGVGALASTLGRVPGLGAALGGVGGILAATTALRTVGRLGAMVGLRGGGGGKEGLIATALLGRWSIRGLFGGIKSAASGMGNALSYPVRAATMRVALLQSGMISAGFMGRQAFVGVGRAVLGIVNPLAIARGALTAFKIALAATGIGLGILGIAAAAEFIRTNFEGMTVAWEAFKGAFMRAIEPVQEALNPFLDQLGGVGDTIRGIWDFFTKPIPNGNWADWGVEAGKAVGTWAKDNKEAILNFASAVRDTLDLVKELVRILTFKIDVPWWAGGPKPTGAFPADPNWRPPANVASPQGIVGNALNPVNPIVATMQQIMDLQRQRGADGKLAPELQARYDALIETLDKTTRGAPAAIDRAVSDFALSVERGGAKQEQAAAEILARVQQLLGAMAGGASAPAGAPQAATPTGAAYHTGDNHFHIYGERDPDATARAVQAKIASWHASLARGAFGDFGVTVGA